MPRQPFLPTYKDKKLVFGPAHIQRKPSIAAAVGRCIMLWSYVEWQMAMLLAAVMKADSEASIAIFLTLRNARVQRDVLIAAADMTLSEDNRETFDAIMLLYGGLQAQRADIAHGIFGHVEVDNDAIIPWIETKNISNSWIQAFHKPKREDGSPKVDAQAEQKRLSFIYKISDLEQLEKEMHELWGIAFSFTNQLRWPGNELATEAFEKQRKAPQMQQALTQVRSRKKASDHTSS
jgi:hypothetical protein